MFLLSIKRGKNTIFKKTACSISEFYLNHYKNFNKAIANVSNFIREIIEDSAIPKVNIRQTKPLTIN